LKGWITRWLEELEKIQKRKRVSKKALERAKVLRKKLKEARAAERAKRKKPAKKRPPVRKPEPKKKRQPAKPRTRPAPKKKRPAKRPQPRKPVPKKKRQPVKPRTRPVPKKKRQPKKSRTRPRTRPSRGLSEKQRELQGAFEEQLREFERQRQEERTRHEQIERELKEKLKALEERREQIVLEGEIEKLPVGERPKGPLTPEAEEQIRIAAYDRLDDRFDELLEIARRTEQLPVPKEGGDVDSEMNTGTRVVIGIGEYLEEETLEEILYNIDQASKSLHGRLPIWLCSFDFSAAGKDLVGYGIQPLKADDADALKFQAQGIESTGSQSSRSMMLLAAKSTLEELIDQAHVTVFMHFATIMNYSRKNKNQQSKWRKNRREQARKKFEEKKAGPEGEK
jgi:hypothetical protein